MKRQPTGWRYFHELTSDNLLYIIRLSLSCSRIPYVDERRVLSSVHRSDQAIGTSRYESIARELASAIAIGHLAEGERFSCRKLARRYKVSPETVRRSVLLLEEMRIARLDVGSGAVVLSCRHAKQYLKRLNRVDKAGRIQAGLQVLIEERRRLDQAIDLATGELLSYLLRENNTVLVDEGEVEG